MIGDFLQIPSHKPPPINIGALRDSFALPLSSLQFLTASRHRIVRNPKIRGEFRQHLTSRERAMKPIAIATFALLFSNTAFAQMPAQSGPGNNAINSEQKNSNAPVAGRNSFTESQAKSAIEKAGYTNVSELKKDNDGVWRGKASKGGTGTAVTVDFQGNVNVAK
jgi:hypothetical protein